MCLQNPPFLCLVCGDMTWNDTECISLDVLQLMTPAGLCPLPPSQGNHGKKGGDGKLALECSRDTSTQAINCGTPLRFSVPLEQHRTQGKGENLLKDRNKCLSLAAPGIMLIKLYIYIYICIMSNCFKTRCAFTTNLCHRVHLRLVFAANAKVYAGSVAAVQETACRAAKSLSEQAALLFNSLVLG